MSNISQRDAFLQYLSTCVKTGRSTNNNPLFLAGNAPRDYARFLESDRLFDYNPAKWAGVDMYEITDADEALEIFNKLYHDPAFLSRNNIDNQGWRQGAISHYVCFLRACSFIRGLSSSTNKLPLTGPVKVGDLPLQQIFYGAPGTGKSYAIDGLAKGKKIRTTFHPDSDYSTFVGAYKPIATDDVKNNNIQGKLSISELKQLYMDFVGQTPKPTRPEITFAGMYWYQLEQVSSADWPLIFDGSVPSVVTAEVPKGISAGKGLSTRIVSGTKAITYEFVPQAFVKAYVEAWRDLSEPVYLVIEEINRGNCAQIFGDIFQLLDRKESGFSSYQIDADQDLQSYLKNEFEQNGIDSKAFAPIRNGERLCLPPNLYIWATMNTSDQSLFPIDSAFKRRWEWVYVPIDTEKENWSINVDGKNWSWTSFLNEINDRILDKTQSEDKQLGFYFCKAKDGVVDAKTFVGKVLFYLWNDVYKDYGFDEEIFDDEDGKKLSFRSFYQGFDKINEQKVAKFLENLKVKEAGV